MVKFFGRFNGYCKFGENKWISNEEISFFTDSAGNRDLGAGLMFKKHWAFFPWLESWRGKEIMSDITFLKLVPIVLSIFLFRHELANKWIVFHTDDKALVSIFNKKSSKSRRVIQLLRPFVLQTMIHNMQFKACHIQGNFNCKADASSRKHFKAFKKL